MANARCTACGKEHGWHAGRGMRLADLRSPCCGAPLAGMTSGKASKIKGRDYETCVLCGRRRLGAKHPPRPWKERYRTYERVHDPGLPVCWLHEIIPADKPLGWPGDEDEARARGEWAEYETWREECRASGRANHINAAHG